MVTDCGGIVTHFVEHLGTEVGRRGVDKVIIISSGLPLQDVSVVKQHNGIASYLLTKLVDVGCHASQTAFTGLGIDKVVGQVIAMHIGGGQEGQIDLSRLSGNAQAEGGKGEKGKKFCHGNRKK